jgi:hypothetical protein
MSNLHKPSETENNVRDRYNSPPPPQNQTGGGFTSFLMGMLVMALLGVGGVAAYLYTQRQQPLTPAANAPTLPPTATPAPGLINSSEETTAQTTPLPPPTADSNAPLPAPKSLNLQVNHPNGSVARLTNITFGTDSTVVEMNITNGSRNPIKLNNSNDMVLKDNLGNQYNLSAPPNNPEIEIKPGTTLKGQFVFLGRILPSATTITLTTNDKFGGNQNFSATPKIEFVNIPIQAETEK